MNTKRKKALKPNDFKTFKVVETVELESTTPCMSSKYSNQLSYASVYGLLYYTGFENAIVFLKNFQIYNFFIEMPRDLLYHKGKYNRRRQL